MGAIAIIPARGGSKRLPRKNIVDFMGRPIIAYTIAAAHESGCFESVVVSTEDHEIAEVAARFGAQIDIRPETLATDTAGVSDVCVELLQRERSKGHAWDIMGCLYATAPLRTAADIRATMALLEPGICGFAMGVTAYDLQPHLALKFGENASLVPMWPELTSNRASDMPPLRVSNGTSYGVYVDAFLEARSFYGPNMRGYDMPRERSVDIDTLADLEYARWIAGRTGFAEGSK